MRLTSRISMSLGAACALLFITGCANSAAQGSPSALPATVAPGGNAVPAKSGGDAFISDSDNHAVYVIDAGGQISETLQVDGPAGVAVDASANLYVANVAGSNVLVYAPPYTGSPKTLEDSGYRPNGVAVDAKGDVAVTSFASNTYGAGSIAFYAPGATTPTNVILANAKFAGDYYCAFDANGNLYLDAKSGSGPFEVGEVVGGITGKSVKSLTTGNILPNPGGIQVTHSGQIAILNQSTGSNSATIYTYNAPHNGSLGKPVKMTQLSSSSDALAFAFEGRNDRFVLTADTFFDAPKGLSNHEDQIGQTQLFNYPNGGVVTSVRLPYNATLVGVAVSPPAKP